MYNGWLPWSMLSHFRYTRSSSDISDIYKQICTVCYYCACNTIQAHPPQELKLASFHELACISKLTEGINANLIVGPYFEEYTRYFRQTLIRICEVKQTLTLELMKVREIHVRSMKARLALRAPASLFTLASSWKLASHGWPSIPRGDYIVQWEWYAVYVPKFSIAFC